jgi:hypothetical protein
MYLICTKPCEEGCYGSVQRDAYSTHELAKGGTFGIISRVAPLLYLPSYIAAGIITATILSHYSMDMRRLSLTASLDPAWRQGVYCGLRLPG